MAFFQVTYPDGKAALVQGPSGDEATVREALAGKGESRDESVLSHDSGVVVSELKDTGTTRVVWEGSAAPADGKKKS